MCLGAGERAATAPPWLVGPRPGPEPGLQSVACLQMILGAIIAGILATNYLTLADNEPLNYTAVLGVTTTHYIDKLSFLPQKRRWRLEKTIAEETK